jgi:hypothetical protein
MALSKHFQDGFGLENLLLHTNTDIAGDQTQKRNRRPLIRALMMTADIFVHCVYIVPPMHEW